jgi:hypothetical protein
MNATLTPNATALELLGTPSTLVVIIKDTLGKQLSQPVYECQTWEKVAEFLTWHKENEMVKNAELQVWHYSTHLATLFVSK